MEIVLGKIYQIDITGLNHDGDGVGRIDGAVVFVKNALSGEQVSVKITAKYKSVYRGEVISILQPSAERVAAICDVYDNCGGCQLQHLSYAGQLAFKRDMIINAITRIAKVPVADDLVLPVIGMVEPYYYRNKAMLSAGKIAGKVVLRFQEEGSHRLAAAGCKFLFPKAMQTVVEALEKTLTKHNADISSTLLGVMLRYSSYNDKIQIIMIANKNFVVDLLSLVDEIKAISPSISGIGLAMNSDNDAADMLSIYRGVKMLSGSEYLEEKIGDKVYRLGPASFFQVNTVQAKTLYDCVKDFAALSGKEVVVDAYCGTGTIGIYVGEKAGKLIGIDVVKDAIADADYNAKANGVDAAFHIGKVEVLLSQLVEQGLKPDVVIVDPPRKGCDQKLLQTLGEVQPQRIVYVSCDPATLARDVKILAEYGYELKKVQPVDLFPQTVHVEAIILMTRSGLGEKK